MVNPDNYAKVLEEFRELNNNQPIFVFAILKMDELVDKWSILVSVDWINQDNRKIVFDTLIKSLQSHLTKEEMSEIARIAFYTPDEHLMILFRDKFETGQYIKEDARVNGNVIHEGHILLVDKNSFAGQSKLGLGI